MEVISNNKTAANTVEVEFKVDAEGFDKAINAAYNRKKKNIAIPGFRKGKATRKMIEQHYGEGVFYEDAINGMYQNSVSEVIDQLGLKVVDMPNIEVQSVSKDEGVAFKATFTVKPEIEISDYLGLKIGKTVKNVEDADIDAELTKLQQKNARIVEVEGRASEKGDTAVFDFAGYCDGKAFEGGSAKDFSLEIGSNQFIPGFEDQMIGKNVGEDFDVNVRFPADYTAKDLADKEATFKCKINSLKTKELVAIDDDFAKDYSEFESLDELKEDFKKKLAEKNEQEAQNKFEAEITDAVIGRMKAEVPEVMFEHRIDDMIRDWEFKNKQQGINVETYLKYTGSSMEQFRAMFKEPAERQVKLRLALEQIAKQENVVVDDEALDVKFKEMADEYKMDVERVKSLVNAESLREDLVAEKTYDLIKNSAK